MSPIGSFWLALSLVMTTATQLRAANLPIGPGEMLLAAWLVGSTAKITVIQRGRTGVTEEAFWIALFWVAATAMLSLGCLVRLSIGIDDEQTSIHDTLALGLAAATSVLVSVSIQHADIARRLAAYLALTSAVITTALLALALMMPRIGPLEFWYQSVRFQGWAVNPNQLALLTVCVPFVCLQLARDARTTTMRVAFVSAAAMIVIVGLTTSSDALILTWIGCGVVAGLMLMWGWIKRGTPSAAALWLAGLLLSVLVAGAWWLIGSKAAQTTMDLAWTIYEVGGQGSTRMALWEHAMEALMKSPWTGLGPGAYAGYSGPFEGVEAHNTMLDWTISTGIGGGLMLLGLFTLLCLRVWRTEKRLLLVALLALLGFSMFHYVLRQPLFWAWLIVVYGYVTMGTGSQRLRLPGHS